MELSRAGYHYRYRRDCECCLVFLAEVASVQSNIVVYLVSSGGVGGVGGIVGGNSVVEIAAGAVRIAKNVVEYAEGAVAGNDAGGGAAGVVTDAAVRATASAAVEVVVPCTVTPD